MWFERVTKVPFTWKTKQATIEGSREGATRSVKTKESHLNDAISRLDSSSHRRSIWDTHHRGGVTRA